jgi:catechol 2,3-dioxygenase-like lactoylglutathione lyase family enzyme
MNTSVSFPLALAAGALVLSPAAAQDRIWLRQFGTQYTDRATSLAADGQGGIFAYGTTGIDPWLARYDAAGNRLWLLPCPPGIITADGAGGIYLATWGGNTPYLLRFSDTGALMSATVLALFQWHRIYTALSDGEGGIILGGAYYYWDHPFAATDDAWMARFNSSGARLWHKNRGGPYNDDATLALAPDGMGGFLAAGYDGPYDPTPVNGWVARYNLDGTARWGRTIVTTSADYATAVAADRTGGAYAAGSTGGSVGGISFGGRDAWLIRYDAIGNRLWDRQIGTSGQDEAVALAPDGAGGVYIAGITTGNLAAPSAGGTDIWLARYDGTGLQLWVRQFGSPDADHVHDMAPGPGGGIYLAGQTGGSLGGPLSGAADAWVARFGCYANCDGSATPPVLNVEDFTCFINQFAAAQALPYQQQLDHYANCDQSTTPPVLNVEDFSCFINRFAAGCP